MKKKKEKGTENAKGLHHKKTERKKGDKPEGKFAIYAVKIVPKEISLPTTTKPSDQQNLATVLDLDAGDPILLKVVSGLKDMQAATSWLKKNGSDLHGMRLLIVHIKADLCVKVKHEMRVLFEWRG